MSYVLWQVGVPTLRFHKHMRSRRERKREWVEGMFNLFVGNRNREREGMLVVGPLAVPYGTVTNP